MTYVCAIDYDRVAGQELRRLRQQRHMTLREAAQHTKISMPMLSRKERGEDQISRQNIRNIIAGYRLTPEEAYCLWTTAGFLPETMPKIQRSYEVYADAQKLLRGQCFPAMILDSCFYILAWNQALELIWSPSASEFGRVHFIHELFSPRLRQRLGDQWDSYIVRTLRYFYHRTLPVAQDPDFQGCLNNLCAHYGDLFIKKWNQAQILSHTPITTHHASPANLSHNTPYGLVTYIVMENIFYCPQRYIFLLYMPCNHEAYSAYEQFFTIIGKHRVYFAP